MQVDYRGFIIEQERRKRGFVAHTRGHLVELPEAHHPTGYYESEAAAKLGVDVYLLSQQVVNYRGFVIKWRQRGYIAHTPEPIHSEIGTIYGVELPRESPGYYESEADAKVGVNAYLQKEEDRRLEEQEWKRRKERKVNRITHVVLVAMLVAAPFVIYFGWSFLRSLNRIELLLLAILVVLCVGLFGKK